MLRCLEIEFLSRSASCVAVSSICAAPFSNMCSTQVDNNSRKLRLRCGCQFLWCALALRYAMMCCFVSLWLFPFPLDTAYARTDWLCMQVSHYCKKLHKTVHQGLRKISLVKKPCRRIYGHKDLRTPSAQTFFFGIIQTCICKQTTLTSLKNSTKHWKVNNTVSQQTR
jgi:hypothetical protein